MSSDKPFTETNHMGQWGVIEPALRGTYLRLVQHGETVHAMKLDQTEARALYEYLKRHFEQSDRERLRAFCSELMRQQLLNHIGEEMLPTLDTTIDEFLKSEEEK